MDHFINPNETYTRKLDLQKEYVSDAALYISRMRGCPLDEARNFVIEQVKVGGGHAFHDPMTYVLVRQNNGDREKMSMCFSEFLQSVYRNRQSLSPSMAAYIHPDVKKSLLAIYIDKNLHKRKKAKAEMFVAKMSGNKVLAQIGNSKQATFKIKNNSLSGAHSSPYTILWNKSSHSTLTSTCRVATSYGNTNNEKFLYGNRHYWCPDIARNNIISIVNHTDLAHFESVMVKYDLQAPSMELVESLLHRCCDNYWRDAGEFNDLMALMASLTKIERSAFVFTSDLYHLAEANPTFVRGFLGSLSHHPAEPLSVEESEKWIKRMDGNLEALVFMLCSKELAGGTLKDAGGDGTQQLLKVVRPDDFGRIGAAAKSVLERLDYYSDFIRTFWITDNLPASVFQAPSIIRRGAITSDTDSTIFTVQYWTTWYQGKLDFTKESEDIASATVYLAAQLIRHILATTSGAMGIATEYVTKLSMKNEYYFTVFSLTSRAKHYFGYRAAQEGNVFREAELEIKGVALRNSNVPVEITSKAHGLIRFIMDNVKAGKKINLTQVLRFIAKIEEAIRVNVMNGSYSLLSRVQIKGRDAYKNPDSSSFLHYDMWESVFAQTYGHAPAPPYVAVKVPVSLDRKTDMAKWLDQMANPAIADNFRKWLETHNKTTMAVFMLPEQVLAQSGIPQEIVDVANIRPLIIQTVESFYLILESLGIFMKNKEQTRLVSDQTWLLENDWPMEELDIQ